MTAEVVVIPDCYDGSGHEEYARRLERGRELRAQMARKGLELVASGKYKLPDEKEENG